MKFSPMGTGRPFVMDLEGCSDEWSDGAQSGLADKFVRMPFGGVHDYREKDLKRKRHSPGVVR